MLLVKKVSLEPCFTFLPLLPLIFTGDVILQLLKIDYKSKTFHMCCSSPKSVYLIVTFFNYFTFTLSDTLEFRSCGGVGHMFSRYSFMTILSIGNTFFFIKGSFRIAAGLFAHYKGMHYPLHHSVTPSYTAEISRTELRRQRCPSTGHCSPTCTMHGKTETSESSRATWDSFIN